MFKMHFPKFELLSLGAHLQYCIMYETYQIQTLHNSYEFGSRNFSLNTLNK